MSREIVRIKHSAKLSRWRIKHSQLYLQVFWHSGIPKWSIIMEIFRCIHKVYFRNNTSVGDPPEAVKNGDIIELVHGMTSRMLNRYSKLSNM